MKVVKAIAVREPWASQIAAGATTTAFKSFRTPYRGEILIVSDDEPWYGVALAELSDVQAITREMNASVLKTAGAFLKPEQVSRLKQIANQVRGAQAFADPEVAKKLSITDSQKTDIEEIQRESMQEMRSIFQDNHDDPEARMKKMNELRKQTLSKVEGKLNDEQRKQAVVSADVPDVTTTPNSAQAQASAPEGIPSTKLGSDQRESLMQFIRALSLHIRITKPRSSQNQFFDSRTGSRRTGWIVLASIALLAICYSRTPRVLPQDSH